MAESRGLHRKRCKTIFINTRDNSRVPHHVELEYYSMEKQGNSLFIIRPMVPLEHGTTYVVGIRNIKDSNGAKIKAPENFCFATRQRKKIIQTDR